MKKLLFAILAALFIPALSFAGASTGPQLTAESNLTATHQFWVWDAAGTADRRVSIAQIFQVDPDIATVAAGIDGVISGDGAGQGYRASTFADIVALWTTCTSGFLQYDGTCAAGGGTVDISGTPANHYWGVFTDSDTLKGVSVAASSPVCTDANGDPTACTTIPVTGVYLKSANEDPAVTAGHIIHDNDSTETTGGGGVKVYDGTGPRLLVDTGTNHTKIRRTEIIPARYMELGTAAAAAAINSTSAIGMSFGEGEYAEIRWSVPDDFIDGIKYRVHYALSADATSDDTIVFSMTGCVLADSGTLSCTAGTALEVSDELTTDDDQYEYKVSDYSAEADVDWGLAAGKEARLVLTNAATGDYVGEPVIIKIELEYYGKIRTDY